MLTNSKKTAIDFKRDKTDVSGKVIRIDYTDNGSLAIALIEYKDGEKRYIIAPAGIAVGDIVNSGSTTELKNGDVLSLKYIPPGTFIHNIELQPGQGGKMVKSAGTAAQVVNKDEHYSLIHLPSGKLIQVPLECRATIGRIMNNRSSIRDRHKSQDNIKESNTVDITKEKPASERNEIKLAQPNDKVQLSCSKEIVKVSSCQTVDFTITAINTGELTWNQTKSHFLELLSGAEYFQNIKDYFRLELNNDEQVLPGYSKTWQIKELLAPGIPGNYTLVWQMINENKQLIGDRLTVNVIVDKPAEVEYPLISSPVINISPSSGTVKTKFKIDISNCTANNAIVLTYETYSSSDGWQIVRKVLKSDKYSQASTYVKWKHCGTYSLWAMDNATDIKTISIHVSVISI